MKKLYFLNEEESNRILNLHKDATKRQYLKEEEDADKAKWDKYACIRNNQEAVKETLEDNTTTYKIGLDVYFSNGIVTRRGGKQESYDCESEPLTSEVQKPVQSVNKPLVMDIQRKLKLKDIYIGKTGAKEDGVDGVMGKLTLNGIISLLGGPEPIKPATPLTKKPTEDLIKPVTTTGTPVAGATEGTPVVAGATAETPEAAAAAAAAAAEAAATEAAATAGAAGKITADDFN